MSTSKKHPTIADRVAVTAADLEWRFMGPGVSLAHLLKDPEREFTMILLRFAPGSAAVRHVHPEGEQYYVLEGSITDENGTHTAGTFVNHPPGSVHAPSSTDGALVLVTWFGKLSAY